jgi:hypothetical protein
MYNNLVYWQGQHVCDALFNAHTSKKVAYDIEVQVFSYHFNFISSMYKIDPSIVLIALTCC